MILINDFIATWRQTPFAASNHQPWDITQNASALIESQMVTLNADYEISGGIAIHKSATVESGAVLKGPLIIGPKAFVAANAYLRGGVFLDESCIVGPCCELKTCFMFAGSKVAHLSFVGDSLIGARANIEAGAMIANYRNEMDDKSIRIVRNGVIIETGTDKFGALVGDDVKIGANAVIAPGALLEPGTRIARLTRIDQHPESLS